MQKQVSKQSLAVLALSILLAISMALTATFAAFQQTNTVTGTITFNDGFTVTASGFASGNDTGETQTFTTSIAYANGDATITNDNASAKWTIEADGVDVAWTATLANDDGQNLITQSATKSGTLADGETLNLADLIVLDSTVTAEEMEADDFVKTGTYTITVEFKAVDAAANA